MQRPSLCHDVVAFSGPTAKVDTAENFTFEQSVEDGHLDIEFVQKVGSPKVSAIAIERLP